MKGLIKKIAIPLYFIGIAIIVVLAIVIKPFDGEKIVCPIRQITGLNCLSCGTTRAVYCLIRGDFKNAFYYNAIFTMGFIPAFLFFLSLVINFSFGKRLIPIPKFKPIYVLIIIAVAVIFVIVRNLTTVIY